MSSDVTSAIAPGRRANRLRSGRGRALFYEPCSRLEMREERHCSVFTSPPVHPPRIAGHIRKKGGTPGVQHLEERWPERTYVPLRGNREVR